jgi:hypothetical protein
LEVAFRGGDPDPAEGVKRCEQLGARRVAVIPADFGSADFGPTADTPMTGVINGGALLAPSVISGMLATRIAGAMLKFTQGDNGITVRSGDAG